MDSGEKYILNIGAIFLIYFIVVAVRFLFRLLRKALAGLLKRNRVPEQAVAQSVPQPVAPTPEKEETVKVPVPDRASSGEKPWEGTIPLGSQWDSAVGSPRFSSHQLRALSGEHKGKTFPLYEMEEFTIGRNPQCLIRFRPDTQGVSGLHCKVEVEEHSGIGTSYTEIRLTDLNSTYGTYLGNGTRLTPNREYPLRAGDTFLLANGGPAFLLEKNETLVASEYGSPENVYPHTTW